MIKVILSIEIYGLWQIIRQIYHNTNSKVQPPHIVDAFSKR